MFAAACDSEESDQDTSSDVKEVTPAEEQTALQGVRGGKRSMRVPGSSGAPKKTRKGDLNGRIVKVPDIPCLETCPVVFVSQPNGEMKPVPLWPQYNFEGVEGKFIRVSPSELWFHNVVAIKRARKKHSDKDGPALRPILSRVATLIYDVLQRCLAGDESLPACALMCARTHYTFMGVSREVSTCVHT